ncbi:hypothetical protein TNCV_4038991 [Trichonephila clavipes]|nr:hypothetical protein TNCV_4038991 [Trichonephila clavipes]
MDFVIVNHCQGSRTTPELALASPNYHTTPTGGLLCTRQLRVLVAALWDKKLTFRTGRGGNLGFYGRTATQGEKDIFGSRAAIEFSLGEGERPAQRRSN